MVPYEKGDQLANLKQWYILKICHQRYNKHPIFRLLVVSQVIVLEEGLLLL
jgi:hypothetical protein